MSVLGKNKCFRLIQEYRTYNTVDIHWAQNVLWNPKMNPTQKWFLYTGIWKISQSLKNILTGTGVSYKLNPRGHPTAKCNACTQSQNLVVFPSATKPSEYSMQNLKDYELILKPRKANRLCTKYIV